MLCLLASAQTFLVRVSQIARQGETPEERNQLALEAVQQLEFEFEKQQAEPST